MYMDVWMYVFSGTVLESGLTFFFKGLWEGFTEKELLDRGIGVTNTPPFQSFANNPSSAATMTDLSSFGNMTFIQIEERFDRWGHIFILWEYSIRAIDKNMEYFKAQWKNSYLTFSLVEMAWHQPTSIVTLMRL